MITPHLLFRLILALHFVNRGGGPREGSQFRPCLSWPVVWYFGRRIFAVPRPNRRGKTSGYARRTNPLTRVCLRQIARRDARCETLQAGLCRLGAQVQQRKLSGQPRTRYSRKSRAASVAKRASRERFARVVQTSRRRSDR